MRSTFTLLAAALLSTAVSAQPPASDQDHAAHHPDGASAPAAVKKPAVKPKVQAAKASASAASAGMGMGGDMGKMHDQAHKPGGMHDQMHSKDGKMMGGQMSAMPAASAASK